MVMADGPVEAAEFQSGSVINSGAGVLPHAKPWRRFFARQIDFQYLMLLASIVASILTASTVYSDLQRLAFVIASSFTTLLLNAIIITIFGNSLGKMVLGIRVRPLPPIERPSLFWNLKREMRVLFYGLGMSFPLISVITMCVCFTAVRETGSTGYDVNVAFVEEKPIGRMRKVFAILLGLALILTTISAVITSTYSEHEAERATSWQNPVTKQTVVLPAGWTVELVESNPNLYQFTTNLETVGILLGADTIPGMDLKQYADALTATVSKSMTFDGMWQPGTLAGRPTLIRNGRLSNGYPATTVLWQADGVFWRMVAIEGAGDTPPDMSASALAPVLASSTKKP